MPRRPNPDDVVADAWCTDCEQPRPVTRREDIAKSVDACPYCGHGAYWRQ